jgi:trans-aconitate methyltransferase
MQYLTKDEAKKFYDGFGERQDLLSHLSFQTANAVFEFGCGTGAFAQDLFKNHLSGEARYCRVDISNTISV